MDIAALSTGYFFAITLMLCMVWVVVSDTVSYIIPNTLNALIVILFVVAAIVLPIADWLPALGAAGLVLAFGLLVFVLGLMGGGDIKLLVALTLWIGWDMATVQFLFLTAISGGALALILLPLRALAPALHKGKPLPRVLTKKQPVPYGIAIAIAFAWLLVTGNVPALR